jgi:hypothetical protein
MGNTTGNILMRYTNELYRDSNEPFKPTTKDVLKVADMFCQRGIWSRGTNIQSFPQEIVFSILEFANYTSSKTVETEECVEGCNLDRLYLKHQLPQISIFDDATPSITGITIVVESHDQGWSSYPADQGTYRGSATWGEINILRDGQEVLGQRVTIYTNLHAIRDWQTHVCQVENNAVCKDVMKNLQNGDSIALYARSCYPGWCNYVRKASITINYL